jgi:hypothetical protein
MRTRPQAEVAEYISKVKEQLGVYPGQVWNLLEHDRRIASGRRKTLHRLHFLLAEVIIRPAGLRAAPGSSGAGGPGAQSLSPVPARRRELKDGLALGDVEAPLPWQQFGGSKRELQAIASYSTAIEELEARMRKERGNDATETEDVGDEAFAGKGGKPKIKAKAKGAST